ncbi:hypothetical protein DFH08DRAFT_1086309 [Mycena albidolilacea]|uniref:Uncharacterized protein n=1 Tax=Mycena albidolilacea TaxID=1033008 RepID=A0AAD6ZDZ0_9AGAR|nr:hypothetical protein DFH08DRAFT_1086309 [Mycena albidolilacea]
MSPNKLAEVLTSAQRRRDLCQTTPTMHAYQRISILAVEVFRLTDDKDARKKVSALAAHAAKKTDALITNRVGLALSSEGKKALDEFERHSVPERGNKPSKVKFGLSALTFRHESARLKAQLDRVYQSLNSKARTRARDECILEVATLGTRVAGAVCEIPIPGLSFLKPVVGLAVLICDTAKTMNGNNIAAVALAHHAEEVTHSVVERAEKEQHGNNNAASVDKLRLTLEEIQAFLEHLKSRRRATAWLMAMKDKDRFAELNSALDRALVVFCCSQSIAITASVQRNTQELVTLAATVNRVEEGVERTITISFAGGEAKDGKEFQYAISRPPFSAGSSEQLLSLDDPEIPTCFAHFRCDHAYSRYYDGYCNTTSYSKAAETPTATPTSRGLRTLNLACHTCHATHTTTQVPRDGPGVMFSTSPDITAVRYSTYLLIKVSLAVAQSSDNPIAAVSGSSAYASPAGDCSPFIPGFVLGQIVLSQHYILEPELA